MCTVDDHMEMVAKMMSEEEASKVMHTYNIDDNFRGYSGRMSTRCIIATYSHRLSLEYPLTEIDCAPPRDLFTPD